MESKRERISNLAGSVKPLLSSSSSSPPFFSHFLAALLCSSSPSLCAPSTSRSKHMAPGASSPTKALGQRSIASMFSNSDRFAKAGGGGRAPRLPLMEFLARKLDKRSVSSISHQVRFSLFSFIWSLCLCLSMCFCQLRISLSFKKSTKIKKYKVLDMREFEKGTPSSIEMPSLHCQKA